MYSSYLQGEEKGTEIENIFKANLFLSRFFAIFGTNKL